METYIPVLVGLIVQLTGEVTTMADILPLLCRFETDARIWEDAWLVVVMTILQVVACI